MKKKEAIKRLKQNKAAAEFYAGTAQDTNVIENELKDIEAMDMAIEALGREQKKYDAICDELLELKSDLNLPIEVAIAYEKSIGVVRKYAKMGGTT